MHPISHRISPRPPLYHPVRPASPAAKKNSHVSDFMFAEVKFPDLAIDSADHKSLRTKQLFDTADIIGTPKMKTCPLSKGKLHNEWHVHIGPKNAERGYNIGLFHRLAGEKIELDSGNWGTVKLGAQMCDFLKIHKGCGKPLASTGRPDCCTCVGYVAGGRSGGKRKFSSFERDLARRN